MGEIKRNDFLAYLALDKGYANTSLNSAQFHLNLFSKWLDKRTLTPEICREFLLYKKSKGSKNNYLRKLAYTLRYLCEHSKLEWKDKIPMPKPDKTTIQIASLEDIEKIINFPDKKESYSLFFEFLTITGCRLSEGINIKISDIQDGIAHIKASKNGQDRYVAIPPQTLAKLNKLIKKRKENDYLFLNMYGGKLAPSAIRRELNHRTDKLKLRRIYPHIFRHSFITEMLRANPPGGVSVIAKMVGHVSPMLTLTTYQHLILDDIKKAILFHPFVKKGLNPYEIVERIKNDIRNYKLEEDKRFFFEISEGNEGLRINIFIR